MKPTRILHRRHFLLRSTGMAAAGLLPIARGAKASVAAARDLAMAHTHTRERIAVVYAGAQGYLPDALSSLNHFLRDHYSGEVGEMDPRLYDLLHQVHRLLGARRPFEVISGFRAPATNAHLRHTRGGGVAQNSLHVQGRAVDVRLPGVALADLRDAAVSLQAGGVGFYPAQQFVHIDTGRVRRW
jgi:uncharacterized protein YcbK (DUF882 family)